MTMEFVEYMLLVVNQCIINDNGGPFMAASYIYRCISVCPSFFLSVEFL